MKKRLILFIYFFLVILGLGVVTEPYISYSLSGTDYGIVGVASLLEIFYIAPVFLLLFLLRADNKNVENYKDKTESKQRNKTTP